ncbi:hypothetical protein [uncultured Hydrogenophaga sp.]|uniref:hypothetical protein n=1 Tax=uncultured Hydrogenophaga sp. TaxID=199683 RepID=UPI00265EC1C2|nr:hypothetical protein [uncultured Hydrogenophaga sp.]
MTRFFFALIGLMFWAAAASQPFLIHRYIGSYRRAIGCEQSGDCYMPGSDHLLDLQALLLFSASTIWPLFTWYMIVKPWRAYSAKRNDRTAA